MSSKSFNNHQQTAIDRQKVAEVALHNVYNINAFHSYEEEDTVNKDLDVNGIDAEISTDEGTKFVAIKTRSSYKRNLENIDIGLRVAGRNRKPSKEWERFISDSKPVPHILVFITYNKKEEVQEVLVLDFKKLKEVYKLGYKTNKLLYEFGKVDYYDCVIDTDIKNAAYKNDDGIFAFLNIDDIRDLKKVKLYHMNKNVDSVGF